MKNADMPAMPVDGEFWVDPTNPEMGTEGYHGLTKRETFAMAAMQGLMACVMDTDCTIPELCADAVSAADALLKELEA